MTSTPRSTPLDVSVLIAARDVAATLPAQLAALAAQRTDLRWEVLVADNGSTDGTQDLVRAAAVDLPVLHLVDAAGLRGAGAARNTAATHARGRLLVFCDADDIVAPGWLDALHRRSGPDRVLAGRLEWDLLNDATARRSRALPQTAGPQHTEPLPWLPCAAASNLAVPADLFHDLGGFDVGARFLQDTDLCWRAQIAGADLVFVPDAVVHMRLRRGLRDTWRQGRSTGMGQRWLADRYAGYALRHAPAPSAPDIPTCPGDAAADRHSEHHAADRRHEPSAAGADPARPARPSPRPAHGWPARIARRALIVAGEAARIRTAGDLAALAWSTGFGLGYAHSPLTAPPSFETPRVHAAT